MGQSLTKVFGALGGAAVVFYAIGFVAVQSYTYRNGFEGMFWLTNEFYRDAGAKFLLESVRAPLTAWYIVFPYIGLLYVLIPEGDTLRVQPRRGQRLSVRQMMQTAALVAVMAVTYLAVLSYGDILGNRIVTKLIDALFQDPTNATSPEPKQALAFFTLVVPVTVAVAAFLYRFRGCLKRGAPSREVYGFVLVAYLVFLAIVPIAYGMHLYDWKTVPVKEPRALGERYAEMATAGTGAEMWLVGEFGGRYVFLRKDRLTGEGIIEAVDTKEIKHLPLDLTRSGSLKYDMSIGASGLAEAYRGIFEKSIAIQQQPVAGEKTP